MPLASNIIRSKCHQCRVGNAHNPNKNFTPIKIEHARAVIVPRSLPFLVRTATLLLFTSVLFLKNRHDILIHINFIGRNCRSYIRDGEFHI